MSDDEEYEYEYDDDEMEQEGAMFVVLGGMMAWHDHSTFFGTFFLIPAVSWILTLYQHFSFSQKIFLLCPVHV